MNYEDRKPSKETIIIFKKMEEKFDTHLNYIRQAFDRNDKDHERLVVKIDNFIKGAEDKFACKKTEITVKEMEARIQSMKDKREERSYDWLKYGVTVIVSVGVTMLLANLNN